MAVATGALIESQEQIDEYNAVIRNVINTAILWDAESNPGTGAYFPTHLMNTGVLSGPGLPDIEPLVVAARLAGAYAGWAKTYTNIRNLTWTRNYRRYSGSSTYWQNNTPAPATGLASMIPTSSSQTTVEFAANSGGNANYLNGKYFTIDDGKVTTIVPARADGSVVIATPDILTSPSPTEFTSVAVGDDVHITGGDGSIALRYKVLTLIDGQNIQLDQVFFGGGGLGFDSATNIAYSIERSETGGSVGVWFTTTGATVPPVMAGTYRDIRVSTAANSSTNPTGAAADTRNALNADGAFLSTWEWTFTGTGNTNQAKYTTWVRIRNVAENILMNSTVGTLTTPQANVTDTVVGNYSQEYEAPGAAMDATAATHSIEKSDLITAPNFNAFLAGLKTEWDTARNNAVAVSTYYCHTNCHSNCHSSRRHR